MIISNYARPWLVAGSASLTFGFVRGVHSSFGVFFVALLETFGWSRGVTAGVLSVSLVVDALLSPVVGNLIDRFGPRTIVAAGGLLLAVGFLLCSGVSELWELYAAFGLVAALGFTATGMVPHVVLVSEWFSSRRGLGLGIVYGAVGVGILLLVPLIQWLISLWGWPRVFQLLAAALVVVFIPLVWLTYRRGPLHGAGATGGSGGEWSVSLALRSFQFWGVFISRVVGATGTTVIVTHQVAHVVDIGYGGLVAAGIFGFMGITSAVGRLAFGYIADVVTKPTAYALNIVCAVAGVTALMLATDTSRPWLLYAYVAGFGLAFGSRAIILSAISADIFSGKGFGAIYGFSAVSVGVGGAAGSWLGGALHDATGNYFLSFAVSVSLLLLSALLVWATSLDWIREADRRLWRGGVGAGAPPSTP